VLGSAVLETILGMIFVYLVLSIISSSIIEILAAANWTDKRFPSRALTLKQGIEHFLGPELSGELYNHPIIKVQSPPRKNGKGKSPKPPTGPSYITSSDFALVLSERLIECLSPGLPESELEKLKWSPEEEDARRVSLRARAAVINLRAALGHADVPKAIQVGSDAKAFYAKIPGKTLEVGEIASALIRQAYLRQKPAFDGIEKWFDDQMERISGWYKNRISGWLLVVGFLVALALNADTFRMSQVFWGSEALRKAVAAQAEKNAPSMKVSGSDILSGTGMQGIGGAFDASILPFGWNREQVSSTLMGFRARFQGIAWIGLDPLKAIGAALWFGIWGKFTWLIGLVLTSVAISFGAPFWFNLMNKVIQLRLSTPPPPKSKEPS
jgi:hypothetical protein